MRAQSLYRGHTSLVVFCTALSDCATVMTVDAAGAVIMWPVWEGDRTGFGWFAPRAAWQLPRLMRTFHARWAGAGRSGEVCFFFRESITFPV